MAVHATQRLLRGFAHFNDRLVGSAAMMFPVSLKTF
jgi:hypothetical protein